MSEGIVVVWRIWSIIRRRASVQIPLPQYGFPTQYPTVGSPLREGNEHSHEGPYPMAPTTLPVAFSTMAQVVGLLNTVRIISRLCSRELCGGQPARSPTSGSLAYSYSTSASLSCQWRSSILSVSIIINSKLTLFTPQVPSYKIL